MPNPGIEPNHNDADLGRIPQQTRTAMNIVPDWAPNVHPMIVHFPIGLLFTAVLLDFVSLIRGFDVLRRAVPVFYVMGALTAIVAYFTGRSAGDQVAVPANAESILTEHADLALW